MICYNCGATLTHNDFCTNCGADVARYKKIMSLANLCYNRGLEQAHVRDLSGAIESLRQCLKMNKNHVDARNLLGLVYFEIGEYVEALNEWVISKNLRPTKNVADDYIGMLQENPTKLDVYSQAVKKYNQALSYCYQGTLDLAIIQLKKVVSLNPKFVQARQLLALLYIQSEEWESARKELNKCQRTDVGNVLTLRYLAEVSEVLDIDDDVNDTKSKKFIPETVKYTLDNETIIQPMNRESKTLSTVVNIVIGIAIGVAVACLLILPARISAAKEGLDESLKKTNEQLDAKTAEITELSQDLDATKKQNEKLMADLDVYTGEGGAMTAMDSLLEAVELYTENPEAVTGVAEALDNIDADTLSKASENFNNVYNMLMGKIGADVGSEYYDSGIKEYQSEMYEDAIADLTKAYAYDNSNGDALFNLANAYRKSEDSIKAIETYEAVIENFPDTEMATRSQQYINELNGD
ncbi:MAG: tetratricopeptide repeat protein [Lachnospiraceae bacterium]|nr:tetratricopeptide repeat protein [Candidatus Colinaster equi]